MSYIRRQHSPGKQFSMRVLFVHALAMLLGGCSTAATIEGMIPSSFETMKAHPQTVRVNVTGGQESVAAGRPQITDGAFTQALIALNYKIADVPKSCRGSKSRRRLFTHRNSFQHG